jgi:peptidoglycan hydrolase CwlO-like protein
MKRGLAISTVLLLLAAIWLPLAIAEDTPEYEFSPEMGDDLAAFGRGYVENLMLYSGAGIHLRWGPSFGGNGTALDDRLAELAAEAAGSMPVNTTPLVVPFAEVDPAFAGPAPIDHSQHWLWNATGVEARVSINSVSTTINAETDLAADLMEGDILDAEGLLLVLSALEAARFMDQRLGWDGSMLGPINMSDTNMTDTNASNGWWLPAQQVLGIINDSTEAWEGEVVEVENTLGGSMMALVSLLSLGDYLSNSDFLMAGGNLFPAGTDAEILALANAVFNNIIAVYYDADLDLFIEDQEAKVDDMVWSYLAMVEYSETADMVEYFKGWADARATRMVNMLVQLQNDDGTLALGVTTAVGGAPEAYLPPFLPMPGMASHAAHALVAAVLYDASTRYGGMAYASAARACLAADDANHWNDGHSVYVQDKMAETVSAISGNQVASMIALKAAVENGDVDLARYRISQNLGGIVMSGLQLSETDAHGEDYDLSGPDTNNNTIWKHDQDHGLGNMFGIGPVMAMSATFDDVSKNWSLDNDAWVNTFGLMMAAMVFLDMDGAWFTGMGAPDVSADQAYRMLHWTPEQWQEHTDMLDAEVMDLTDRVSELEDLIDNGTGALDELMEQIASLEENLSAMQEDLNETLENETILRNQTEWLREKLEETNETVDDLEHQITVLESQVERLEESIGEKDENITLFQEQLRSSQHNVTQLQWQMDNASAALSQVEADLAAAERELDDTRTELDDQKSRQALVAVAALVAGMIIVVVILKLIGKL